MLLSINYKEMAYIRELLQKDANYRDTINEELRQKLLKDIQLLEDNIPLGIEKVERK